MIVQSLSKFLAWGVGLLFAACAPSVSSPEPVVAADAVSQRPNVLVIVADDLGYSDIGVFGGEIDTPNLDALAENGVQLANFYVSPACSPTRAMLMTGRDNHEAGFGTMLEVALDDQRGADGYEGFIPRDLPTIAERLVELGYRTIMSGKWHLGPGSGQGPADRGFVHSFALIQGAHNHFGADLEPNYREYGASPTYRINGRPADWPQGGYSSRVFTDHLLTFLNEERGDEPFFAYLAFTAPHWPLQAPDEVIATYRGRYDSGPDAIAIARMDRMQRSGLIDPAFRTRILGDQSRWEALDEESRQHEARQMEVYAAMVEEMDANIGRVIDELRRRGELENTYIIFLSDNGPEGLVFNQPINPMEPGTPLPVPIDNSTDNLGAADSYFSYGPHWGQASAAPFWGTKEHTSEGGIRSAAIISGPGLPNGSIDRHVLHVRDIFPTIVAMAGASDAAASGVSSDAGHNPVNMLSVLSNPSPDVARRDGHLFWELFYRAAIRNGNLKAVYQPTRIPVFGPQTEPGEVSWQLYDLSNDPGETTDLAAERPGMLEDLVQRWRQQAENLGVVLLPEDQ